MNQFWNKCIKIGVDSISKAFIGSSQPHVVITKQPAAETNETNKSTELQEQPRQTVYRSVLPTGQVYVVYVFQPRGTSWFTINWFLFSQVHLSSKLFYYIWDVRP